MKPAVQAPRWEAVADAFFRYSAQCHPCQLFEVLYQWARKAPLGGIVTAQA